MSNPPDVRSREQAIELAMSDPSTRAFYEVFVPAELDVDLLNEGFGPYPSQASHEESDGRWFVLLTDGYGVEHLLELGLHPVPAPLSALPDEDLDTLVPLGASAETAFAASDDMAAGAGGTGPLSPICNNVPDTFCQYTGAGPCEQSIQTQLQNLAAHDDVDLIDVSNPVTYEGRHLYGVRIGPTTSGTDVPTLLLFGALRAREWAGSGLSLELAKQLVEMLEDTQNPETDWVRRVLRNRAVTIVPVANPDGYAFTVSTTAGARDWIKNRKPCFEEPAMGACPCPAGQVCVGGASCRWAGVDVSRNFPFNWLNTGYTCSLAAYEGPAAGSEAEFTALRKVFLDDGIGTGFNTYVTRFVVSYGAYGGYVLYPDGISSGADGATHSPCRTSWASPENCQPPDLPVLRSLAGSEASPILWDDPLTHTIPYKTDTVYRSLYAAVGDPISHFGYSSTIATFDEIDRRALGASVLLTSSAVGYYAECMSADSWGHLVTNQMDLVRRLLENTRFLETEAGAERAPELGDHVGRRIHRLRPEDDYSSGTYGPPRFWVDQSNDGLFGMTMTPPPGFAAGTVGLSSTAGRYYTSYSWKPAGDYIFPGWLRLCPQTGGESCNWVLIDGGAGVSLCPPSMFPPANGWGLIGNNTSTTNEDCYLDVTGRNPQGGGDVAWEIIRNPVNTTYADQVEFDYSYRFAPSAFTSNGKVEVAVRHDGGAWVTVRTYPATKVGGFQPYPSDQRFRTEIVDLPADFDRAASLQVRFRAIGVKSSLAPGALAFRAYDVVFVGRPREMLVDGCISMDDHIAPFDPPGTGEWNDLIVTSGRTSPALCGSANLGPVEILDLGLHGYLGVGGLNNGLNDIRQDYAIGGPSATTDEAFFQTTGGPGPSFDIDNPLYAPLWDETPIGGLWSFSAPGLILDTDRDRTLTQFTIGDRELGYTVQRQFQLAVDRRVKVVPLTIWKLSRDTDHVGPDVDADVVRSWFGEQPAQLTDRSWGSGDWESDLRQFTDPRQTVDSVFAQCPIERRIQHRITGYDEVEVDPIYVDAMEGEDCSSAPTQLRNMQDLTNLVDTTPGVINVYLINSMGPGCEQTVDAWFQTPTHGTTVSNVVFAFQNVWSQYGESGGPFILAHELGHAAGYTGHCGNPGWPPCDPRGDMMCGDVSCVGGALSPADCDVLFP